MVVKYAMKRKSCSSKLDRLGFQHHIPQKIGFKVGPDFIILDESSKAGGACQQGR